jgi:hypothetical protein
LLRRRDSSEETEGADSDIEDKMSSPTSTPPPEPSIIAIDLSAEDNVIALLEDAMAETGSTQEDTTLKSNDLFDIEPSSTTLVQPASTPAIRSERTVSEETESADSTSSGEVVDMEEFLDQAPITGVPEIDEAEKYLKFQSELTAKDAALSQPNSASAPSQPVLIHEQTVSEDTESADSASSPELLDYPDVQDEPAGYFDQPEVDLTGLSEQERRAIEDVIARAAGETSEAAQPISKSPDTSGEYVVVRMEDIQQPQPPQAFPHLQQVALESSTLSEEEVRQIEAVLARAAADAGQMTITTDANQTGAPDLQRTHEESISAGFVMRTSSTLDTVDKNEQFRSPSTYSPIDSSETDGADADEELSPEPLDTRVSLGMSISNNQSAIRDTDDFELESAEQQLEPDEEENVASPVADEGTTTVVERNAHAPGAAEFSRHIEDVSEVDILDAVRSVSIPEEDNTSDQSLSSEEASRMSETAVPKAPISVQTEVPSASGAFRQIEDIFEADIIDALISEPDARFTIPVEDTVKSESLMEDTIGNSTDISLEDDSYIEDIKAFADMLAKRAIRISLPEAAEELQLIARFQDQPLIRKATISADETQWMAAEEAEHLPTEDCDSIDDSVAMQLSTDGDMLESTEHSSDTHVRQLHLGKGIKSVDPAQSA